MATNGLSLLLRIKALVDGTKDVAGLSAEIDKLGTQAGKPIADPTAKMRPEMQKTGSVVNDLIGQLGQLSASGAVLAFVKSSLDAMQKAESGFKGLESVSKYVGVSIADSFGAATRVAADGLISLTDASKALQNLLSRGYDIHQAEATLNRLKDSAAFNRQASLSMSEAVLSATEGLKNENSILVDNAGVTKNVSKMWEDYAKKLGVSVQSLSQAQKIQAEYNGILQETQAQTGNAAKAAEGYQGSMAKLAQEFEKLKTAFGGDLTEGAGTFAQALTFIVELGQQAGIEINKASMEFSYFFQQVGAVASAIANGNLSGLGEVLRRNYATLDAMEAEVEERYRNGLTPAMQDATRAAQGMGEVSASAAKQAADAEAKFTATVQVNAEQLKLSAELLDQQYQRQNGTIAQALQTRMTLIDAAAANDTVKAQQRAIAEQDANLVRLTALRNYETERLGLIDAAYSADVQKTAVTEAQKQQFTLSSIEARKAAYTTLATAYASVVDQLSGQYNREMELFNGSANAIRDLTAAHEQDLLGIKRAAMSEKEKLDSQEKERADVLAKLKTEAAKGEKADQGELNTLYQRATGLIKGVEEAKIAKAKTSTEKNSAEREAERLLTEAFDAQKGALDKIGQQHKANADTLLPSLKEAQTKLGDMNTALSDLDRSLAQAKQLKLELAGLDEVKSQFADLLKTEVKTIIVKTVAQGAAASADESAPEGHRLGGLIRALAKGGKLSGYGGGDTVWALLERGEFVVRKEAVSQYGPGLFAALNARKFAAGGNVEGVNSELDSWTDKLISSQGLTTMTPDMAQILEQKVVTTGNAYLRAKWAEVQKANELASGWKQGIGSSVPDGWTGAIASQVWLQNAKYKAVFEQFDKLKNATYGPLYPNAGAAVAHGVSTAVGNLNPAAMQPAAPAPLPAITITSPASGKAATLQGSADQHQQLVDLLKFHAMTT